MWNTPTGTRVPTGNERRLLVHGIDALWSHLTDEEGEWWESGAPFFDLIPFEDRSYALLAVAQQLLNSAPPLDYNAWNEGAILAVFNRIGEKVQEEIAHDKKHGSSKARVRWRTLVHEAWLERCYAPGDDIEWNSDEGPRQPPRSCNLDDWGFKVEDLCDQFLFDRDCGKSEFMSMPPEIAASSMRDLGIEETYFTAKPPTFKQADRKRLWRFLDTLHLERAARRGRVG
jgi:hypothetical protein